MSMDDCAGGEMTKAQALEIAEQAIWRGVDEITNNLTPAQRRAFFSRCRDALARSIRSTKAAQRRFYQKKKEARKLARLRALAAALK